MTNIPRHLEVGLASSLTILFIAMLALAPGSLAQQPQLEIASPTNGTIFNPGQSISLTVTSPTNTSFASVAMVGEDPFGFSDLASSLPAQFSFTVPTTIASGTYAFTADGITTSGQQIESTPILIDTERPDFPESLSFSSGTLTLTVLGDESPLTTFGHFSDGTILDVTRSAYISYISLNTKVVIVDSEGLVAAAGLGSAYVYAAYILNGKSIQTSILVTVAPYGGSGGNTNSSNFSLAIMPGAQVVTAGLSTSASVSAFSLNGFTGNLALTVSGLPTAASASFSPASIGISGSSTLTVTTQQSTPSGAYIITVSATSGTATVNASFLITVGSQLGSYFTVAASPIAETVVAGGVAAFAVSVHSFGEFSDTVALSVSGLPSGVSGVLSPSSVVGSGSSVLTLTTLTSAQPGTYTLTVTGTSSSLNQTAQVALTVWSQRDVGAVGITGSASYANGVFTVSAAGPEIYGSNDGFHFAYLKLSGDGSLVARVVSVTGMRSGTSAEAGVMIRESLNANSTHASSLFRTGGPLVESMWRGVTGASTSFVNSGTTPLPYWVKVSRSGNSLSAFISPNGAAWTQVGTTQPINMGTNVYVGLAVSSTDSANNSLVTAAFDSVSIGATAIGWPPAPSPWFDQDIGTVGVPGTVGYANGVFTVSGGGQQISGTADGFHFMSQAGSGDVTIVARVLSVTGVRNGTSAEAGVMIRETLTSNARHASALFRTSTVITQSLWRSTISGGSSSLNSGPTPLPYWVKMTRSGNLFSAYVSPNGVTWTQVGSSQPISMANSVFLGLAVSSTDSQDTIQVSAAFDNVSVSSSGVPLASIATLAPNNGVSGANVLVSGSGFGAAQGNSLVLVNGLPAPVNSWSDAAIGITIPSGATSGPITVALAPSMNASNAMTFKVLPSPMADLDIGTVGLAGNASYANGVFTISASGPQIYGTSDGMHFVYQPVSGNCTIVARALSVTGAQARTSPEAGVMIRATLDPNSEHAYTSFRPAGPLIDFFWRAITAGSTSFVNSGTAPAPYWLKVVRNGNIFSSFISPDGVTWTQVGSNQTISMAANIYVGLAVSSNDSNNRSLVTAALDNYSVK